MWHSSPGHPTPYEPFGRGFDMVCRVTDRTSQPHMHPDTQHARTADGTLLRPGQALPKTSPSCGTLCRGPSNTSPTHHTSSPQPPQSTVSKTSSPEPKNTSSLLNPPVCPRARPISYVMHTNRQRAGLLRRSPHPSCTAHFCSVLRHLCTGVALSSGQTRGSWPWP